MGGAATVSLISPQLLSSCRMENMDTLERELERIVIPPTRVCVAPWALQQRGTWLGEWCQHPDHIYIGDGTPLKTLLGPFHVERSSKSRWEYRGPHIKYRRHVWRRMWKVLDNLEGKKLGCFCSSRREDMDCPVMILIRAWRKRQKCLSSL